MDIFLRDGSVLEVGQRRYRCAIGKGGLIEAQDKREGDLATPIGRYKLRLVYYRPDKLEAPRTALPVVALREDMGWCDDPGHARYNQLVRLPFAASHEKMWRDDDCYDVVVVIGHNDDPIIAGAGSAIFLHLAKPDFSGTEGCVAISRDDMLEVLARVSTDSKIVL